MKLCFLSLQSEKLSSDNDICYAHSRISIFFCFFSFVFILFHLMICVLCIKQKTSILFTKQMENWDFSPISNNKCLFNAKYSSAFNGFAVETILHIQHHTRTNIHSLSVFKNSFYGNCKSQAVCSVHYFYWLVNSCFLVDLFEMNCHVFLCLDVLIYFDVSSYRWNCSCSLFKLEAVYVLWKLLWKTFSTTFPFVQWNHNTPIKNKCVKTNEKTNNNNKVSPANNMYV